MAKLYLIPFYDQLLPKKLRSNMSPQKHNYDKEFRDKVLTKIMESDKSTTEIAEEMGMSPALLRQWKHRYIKSKEESEQQQVSREEYDKILKELNDLKIEKEILLKTLNKLAK